jgi:hypothetical protein
MNLLTDYMNMHPAIVDMEDDSTDGSRRVPPSPFTGFQLLLTRLQPCCDSVYWNLLSLMH